MQKRFLICLLLLLSPSAYSQGLLNPANPLSPLNPVNPASVFYQTNQNHSQQPQRVLTANDCVQAAKNAAYAYEGNLSVSILKRLEPGANYRLRISVCSRDDCWHHVQITDINSNHTGHIVTQLSNWAIACKLSEVEGQTSDRWLRFELLQNRPWYRSDVSFGWAFIKLSGHQKSAIAGLAEGTQDIRVDLIR